MKGNTKRLFICLLTCFMAFGLLSMIMTTIRPAIAEGQAWANTGGDVSGYSSYALAWDSTGLYAGTWNHGVWRYDPGTETWTDTGGGVSGYSIYSLAWDGTGLYAGTSGHGVWYYDPGTESWSDIGGGLSSYSIYSLAWGGGGLYAEHWRPRRLALRPA